MYARQTPSTGLRHPRKVPESEARSVHARLTAHSISDYLPTVCWLLHSLKTEQSADCPSSVGTCKAHGTFQQRLLANRPLTSSQPRNWPDSCWVALFRRYMHQKFFMAMGVKEFMSHARDTVCCCRQAERAMTNEIRKNTPQPTRTPQRNTASALKQDPNTCRNGWKERWFNTITTMREFSG